MKFHSPQFERGLKRLVKSTIRRSPGLKHEHRRAKRYRRNLNLTWLWRLALSCLLGFTVWTVQMQTGHLATALAGVGIYLLAGLCFQTQSLWAKLYGSLDLPALTILPVEKANIFHWQLQKFLRGSIFLLVDLLVMLGILAWLNDFSIWKWGAMVLFAGVAWFNVLALAAYSVWRLPRWAFQTLAGGLVVLGLVLFFGRTSIAPLALHLLDGCAPELNLFMPTAWPVAPFELLAQSQHWWLLFLWLPVFLIFGNVKLCLHRILDGFIYREVEVPPAMDLVPGEDTVTESSGEPPKQRGPTEVEDIVSSGSFLVRPGYPLRRLPEQWLWQWLNGREHSLAEFVHPSGLAIGAAWKKLFIVVAATTLLVLLAGRVGSVTQFATLGLGAFVVFCMALANIVNHGRAFTPMWCGGVTVPLYAGYGIGFKELAGFFFKYALVQLPFLVVAFLVLGGVSAWCLGMPISLGVVFGIKVAFLMFASRFILVAFAFSSGTNDSSRFHISSVLLMAFVVVFGIAFLGLGAASLFVPMPAASFMLLGASILDAWLLFWIYGWFYRFCRFDLMALPRQ